MTFNGRTTDVVELLPGSMAVADFIADNPGSWLFHCHVADHMMEGMYAPFVTHPRASTNALSPARAHSLYSGQLPPKALRIEKTGLETRDGTEVLHLTMLFHVANPPRLDDVAVRVELGQRQWSFRLNAVGKAETNDGASFQVAPHKTGGGTGVQMKIELLVPPHPTFRSAARELPVRIHLDKTLLSGTAWLNF